MLIPCRGDSGDGFCYSQLDWMGVSQSVGVSRSEVYYFETEKSVRRQENSGVNHAYG